MSQTVKQRRALAVRNALGSIGAAKQHISILMEALLKEREYKIRNREEVPDVHTLVDLRVLAGDCQHYLSVLERNIRKQYCKPQPTLDLVAADDLQETTGPQR
jgi:hypothetical protein